MPFAGYQSFEACVRSNSDKDDPEAYCATIKRQVEGESAEFDDLSLEAILEAADSHAEELLSEFLQAALEAREADQQAGRLEQQADPMINGHDLDPATGEGVCETTGETIEAETMGELTEDCPHCGEPLSVLAQQADQEAEGFSADVFRIVQAADDEMDLDGDLMGIGVDFPNAGAYVDWRIDAWPDDEQLAEPHVSDYGSIEDLEQATGGDVEHLASVDAVDATEAVVDGEADAAPTDHERPDE